MTVPITRRLAWVHVVPAKPRGEPVLRLRALRYLAEGHPGLASPVAGLRVQPVGVPGIGAEWDAVSGETLFAELPPGPRRILVTDPERRFLPAALNLVIPHRFPPRPTSGLPAPRLQPLALTLRLRAAPSRALPPDQTAVIGTVRDRAGRGVPLARIACATVLEGRATEAVTWSAADGTFVLPLPGEDASKGPLARAVNVHVPVPDLSARLSLDFLGALPPDLDRASAEAGGLFRRVLVTPLAADGTPAEAPAGMLPLRPRRSIRWDLVVGDPPAH
jgi:hypothetical protein